MIGADFNQDGVTDLAVLTPGAELVVLLGAKAGLYRQSYRHKLDGAAHGLYVADLNGDGLLDLAVGHAGGRQLSLFHGRGDGTFSATRSVTTAQRPTWSLTPRELQVAQLAASGHTCKEIADMLGIGRRTAESHVKAVRSKLELKHKRELVQLVRPSSS